MDGLLDCTRHRFLLSPLSGRVLLEQCGPDPGHSHSTGQYQDNRIEADRDRCSPLATAFDDLGLAI